MSDELYNEIREDLKQQQLEAFWKENGAWIIGGIIASILFTAVMSWWRGYDFDRNVAATASLTTAIQAADPAKLETLAETTRKNHALLARFAEARVYAARKEHDKAAAVYQEIAGMSRADKTLRDLAKLYGIGERLDHAEPAALHKDIATLTGKKNPWRFSALEMEALLFARENKITEADAALSVLIADPLTPADIRARAVTMRELHVGDKSAAKKNG